MRTTLAVLAVSMLCGSALGEARRSYYTRDVIDTALRNVRRYGWARSIRGMHVGNAERFSKHSDEALLSFVPPPEIPRAYQVNAKGCPVHGREVFRHGSYPWKIDVERPYRVKCPVGGEEYPSNDFGAFHKSGMGDRSLLTGRFADDGWGWRGPDDRDWTDTYDNYFFVAYYNHWATHNRLRTIIYSLGRSVVLVEDGEPDKAKLFAHKLGVVLWRLAEHYPEYRYEKQSREGIRRANYTGKILNHGWAAYLARTFDAYDAVKPYLYHDRELQRRSGLNGEQLDCMIRERLVQDAARSITETARITCNWGGSQRLVLRLAKVLGDEATNPSRDEMVQYVLDNPKPGTYLDQGVYDAMASLIHRDGVPAESPGYNLGWLIGVAKIADGLAELGIDLHKERRFRHIMLWPFDLCVAGELTPAMGDFSNMWARLNVWEQAAPTYRQVAPYVADARLLWAAKKARPSHDGLFRGAVTDLAEVSDERPAIGIKSTLLPGYKVANLQSGSDENRTANSLFFGSYSAHTHADQLNLTIYSHRNCLLPDFGYPEAADPFDPKRYGYFSNTVAHNTVVVNARVQMNGPTQLNAFEPNGFAQLVDATCDNAYPDVTSLFRRVNIHVEATPTQSYVFDVFYVRGGRQHDYLLHGTQADFSCTPRLGPVQKKGTLAGEDVEVGRFYDDPRLDGKPPGSVSYGGYLGSGFQFLTNVQRAPLNEKAVGDWLLTKPIDKQPDRPWQSIGLRAHALGSDEELIACDGPVQTRPGMPDTVKFMIRRRSADLGDLASKFAAVFEPYRDGHWIKSVDSVAIQPDDGNAAAAKLRLTNGQIHYVFHSLAASKTYTIDGRLVTDGMAACVVLGADGKVEKAMLYNGTGLALDDFALNGNGARRTKIVSLDYDAGIVEVADPVICGDLRPGQVVVVEPGKYGDGITLRKVIDATHFSVGDEDLQAAGGAVVKLDPKTGAVASSVTITRAKPGMMVYNSRMEPVGHVDRWQRHQTKWSIKPLADKALSPDTFPKSEGFTRPRFSIMVAAPGNEVMVPSLTLYLATGE